MNARNKLKTIDLMWIDTHIVCHAQRIITERGGVSLKSEGSWGSEGSSYTDLASRVGVLGVMRVGVRERKICSYMLNVVQQ